jgi:hypothetical protein
MKKLSKSTILFSLILLFLFLIVKSYYGSYASEAFPDLGEGAYIGSFSEPKDIEDLINNQKFILEQISETETVVFSLLEKGSRPLVVPLINSRNIQEDEISNVVYDPLLLFPRKDCRMSGGLSSETFKGVLRCHDGIEVNFVAKRSGEKVFSKKIDELDPLDDSFRAQLQKQIFNIAQLEIAGLHVQELKLDLLALSERKETLHDLDSNSDTFSRLQMERAEKISALKEKRDLILEQIRSLNEERGQLFRVSEKGVQVEHARRLMNLESDFYNRNWIQGGIQEDSIYMPEAVSSEDFLRSPYHPGSQEDSNTRGADEEFDHDADGGSSGEAKEWWKELQ